MEDVEIAARLSGHQQHVGEIVPEAGAGRARRKRVQPRPRARPYVNTSNNHKWQPSLCMANAPHREPLALAVVQ